MCSCTNRILLDHLVHFCIRAYDGYDFTYTYNSYRPAYFITSLTLLPLHVYIYSRYIQWKITMLTRYPYHFYDYSLRAVGRMIFTSNAAYAGFRGLAVRPTIPNHKQNLEHTAHADRQMWISLKKGTAV